MEFSHALFLAVLYKNLFIKDMREAGIGLETLYCVINGSTQASLKGSPVSVAVLRVKKFLETPFSIITSRVNETARANLISDRSSLRGPIRHLGYGTALVENCARQTTQTIYVNPPPFRLRHRYCRLTITASALRKRTHRGRQRAH